MLLIRRFEEKSGQLYGMGLIAGFCHLYIGQEAVAVGMQNILQKNDYTIPSYYILNATIGLKWNWGEWDIYLNNFTNQKYLSNGMIGGDGSPLYFVSEQFCFFTGLKFKL